MNKKNREFDRIAGSRIAKTGGIPKHVALSNKNSIILRNKFKRLGLSGSHIDSILDLADEIGIQETLNRQPLGVRFSTVKTPKQRKKIWKK
jgi:hypothetical protein